MEKRQYVHQLFSQIAPYYDVMNRLMSGGQDQQWRKLLLQQIQLPSHARLLDVATGTGDVALASLRQYPHLKQVVGLDLTLPMIAIGRQRLTDATFLDRFQWSGGDTAHLPFPDNSFEAVVSSFLMRNVADVSMALAEQMRVCRPGGRVGVLDIQRPPNSLFGRIFWLYFHFIVPILGGLITGNLAAYRYLPRSADLFLYPEELQAKMAQIGLRQVTFTKLMFGTVAIHIGVKPNDE